jgi:hypothetical protein
MIGKLVDFALQNRFLILAAAFLLHLGNVILLWNQRFT